MTTTFPRKRNGPEFGVRYTMLAGLKRQRVNVLVYILWDVVLPSLMTDHVQTALLVRPSVMTRAEQQRYRAARDIHGKFLALCTTATISRIIPCDTIAIENNKMTACTCPDFRRSHALCKHMYLLNRVKRIGLLDLRRSQAEIVVNQQVSTPNQQVDQEQLLQAVVSR
ncbi:hypothetical protein BX666DRAFT_1944842 [Dichotomocladium elegans]|nr:hypothetical protein BX666DRAFT_1944842 [Dichotomocladium elegans]